jgi:3-hydroxyisobutyrate dehydrogenase
MIGIGQLGLPIATNLMRAGFEVLGFRRTDRTEFERRGGKAMSSPAEVTAAADVLLMCLPSEGALTEVLTGPFGVLDAVKPAQIIIELGTYKRDFKLSQAKLIENRGGRVLEAEVSGSPPLVAERKAALYLGGSADLIEICKPVLDAITEHHFHIGEFGSAVKMKLIANYLLAIHTLAAAEAMNLATRAGFNPHRVAEVIRQGAGNSTMFTVRAPMMASRTFSPAPGPFNTLEKYIHLGADLVDEFGAASPLFSTAKPYFERAIANGMGEEDISAVIKLLEDESETKLSNGDE